MLSDEQFDQWCERLKLSNEAIAVIKNIRSSPPARRVQGGAGNVNVNYNRALKMPHTVQADSRTVEFAALLIMDVVDDDVLEPWDQPPSFVLSYKKNNGRNIGYVYTADYFVLRKATAGWEEWKTEERLIKESRQRPELYCMGEDGRWRCPPGERYAEQYGLYFHVHSSKEINYVLVRNIKLLHPFLRHLRKTGE